MKTRFFRQLILCSLAGLTTAQSEIEIDAGKFPRAASIVTVPNKADLTEGSLKLDGKFAAHIQKSIDGNLVFIAPPMAAGEKMTLTTEPMMGAIRHIAKSTEANDQIQLSIEGKPVATYQAAARVNPRPDLDPKFLRGGYLHPLVTPGGITVTDDYAINHLHHHGIWTAWTKTSFDGREPDFWNMGQGKGKVDFASTVKSWTGAVESGFVAKHKHTDLTAAAPADVLDETWTVRTYATGAAYHLIDLDSSQTCATDKPLLLPIYHYGGLGIRGREEWNGKDNAWFITSEKFTDRIKANGQPARWIAIAGAAGSSKAGLAILSHPENFRAPQPVRIHPNEPFISFAPQTHEAMSIEPGKPYRARYRIIVFDGEPDPIALESLWQDYAHPITAKWID